MLGAVGAETLGAKHLLERIGFRHVDRIDPFDGGPHYEAAVADITLVRAHRRLRVSERLLAPHEHEAEKVVGVERPDGKVRFRAVRAAARIDGDDVLLAREARDLLQVSPGERVHLVPFD